MSTELTDFTVSGKCSGCGECCSNFLPLTKNEIKRIKKYVKEHNIQEQRRAAPTADATIDLTCPFRDDLNRKCLIYEVRPSICQMFQCNHTIEDIKQNRDRLHRLGHVVFMRSEFFGSTKDESALISLLQNAEMFGKVCDYL